jgi:uncharacterized membrane protein YebE (DUF533 family)
MGAAQMDTYGFVSVIGLAGIALLAYRAYMEHAAAHARAKARRPKPPTVEAAPSRARRRRRRR